MDLENCLIEATVIMISQIIFTYIAGYSAGIFVNKKPLITSYLKFMFTWWMLNVCGVIAVGKFF